MQRSLHQTSTSLSKISSPDPSVVIVPLPEHCSLPPPNYTWHSNSHSNLSPRHSQLPQMISPP